MTRNYIISKTLTGQMIAGEATATITPVYADRIEQMTQGVGASLAGPGCEPPSEVADPYWDYDEHDCANCGGEGFTFGCSWDWQCDTYDEGEGTCLCTRPCDWCSKPKPDPALQAVLRDALNPTDTTHQGVKTDG